MIVVQLKNRQLTIQETELDVYLAKGYVEVQRVRRPKQQKQQQTGNGKQQEVEDE